MTLATIIETLKMIALKHPNVNSAYEGNIYDILNSNPNNKYASVVITQQSHTTDEVYDHYGFVIFYVDRLVDDMEENRVQIQSCGKSMLGNIITFFCEEFEAECDNITYQPFTQKFVDMTCGVYCTITIDTVKDVYCPEEYWKEDWVTPVTVIRNQDKRVTFTENGTYTIDYDPTTYTGLGNVEVDVNIDVDSYYNNGYNQGKTDGIDEQKSKLESINITENGTYTKEDGYSEVVVNVPDLNGDYNEGYEQGHTDGYNEGYTEGEGIGYNQGQADLAAKARVLEVTKNGQYLSKFSDPIIPDTVTGVYADDTEFYSYALISNIIYSTGIIPNQNTRLEFWFKPYGTEYEAWEIIIGSQRTDDSSDSFQVRRYLSGTNDFVAEIGTSEVRFTMSENEWHHIIMSVADGFVLDGTKIGDFSENMTDSNTPLQIGGSINFNGQRTEEGYYGMIKIDDTIIIPTENGFKNVTTDQILQILKDGSYTYTEGQVKYGEGELYKTINVNVIPKINLQKTRLKFGYSTFAKVPEWADFTGVTDMENMFRNCSNLQTLEGIDFSNTQNMAYAFQYCPLTNLDYFTPSNSLLRINNAFEYCGNLRIIPNMDLSSVLDASGLFDSCGSIEEIGDINFENATSIGGFLKCYGNDHPIRKIGVFNVPKVENMSDFFYYSFSPVTRNNLTEMGGFIGLKCNWNSGNGLDSCPNLTKESCLNILNGLYDFTGNGETPNSNQGKLKVHPNFLATVGDKISIGVAKGWTITSN